MIQKYPDIEVKLVGEDGNAYAIIGRVRQALRDHGVSKEEETEFVRDATSGDYNHLLATVTDWVRIS